MSDTATTQTDEFYARTELTDREQAWVDGWREMLDFLEQHPVLIPLWNDDCNVFAHSRPDMAGQARLLGTFEKKDDGSYISAERIFGPIALRVLIAHESFCERKQVGTKTVTKRDPDLVDEAIKDIPEVTVEEPVYEWICPPILAGSNDEGS